MPRVYYTNQIPNCVTCHPSYICNFASLKQFSGNNKFKEMKSRILKLSAIAFMCIAFTITSFSQTTKTTEKVCKKPTKIEKTKVPKVVTEKFILEYPSVMNEGWYGYPKYDFYNDWYGYNPYLYEYENPEFYIVEFTKDKVHHKAIFSKEGKKIAVHKKVTSELPVAITDAIKKGTYSTWKIATENEEIFRDTEMDKMKVYKVEVEKGTKKHHLFYSTDGDLLKDKTIK